MIENVKNKLIELLKNRKILFIEGDNDLYNTVGGLADFLVENKIKYNTILNAGQVNLKGIQELVNFHNVIIWESQYCSETSDNIMKLLFNDKYTKAEGVHTKILLECYIKDPICWYKPKGLNKRLMGLSGPHDEGSNWELYEFKGDRKPIWDKDDNEL